MMLTIGSHIQTVVLTRVSRTDCGVDYKESGTDCGVDYRESYTDCGVDQRESFRLWC